MNFIPLKQPKAFLAEIERVLGEVLQSQLCLKATEQCEWFSMQDIAYAIEAIRQEYLEVSKFAAWSSSYTPPKKSLSVAIVAAGNIPLAGFFDLFCTLAAGHRALIKFSHKDSVLLPAVAEALRSRLQLPIRTLDLKHADRSEADIVLASGGQVAMSSIDQLFPTAHKVLRTHRESVAVLTGGESAQQLDLLADDMFRYNSLGCRNVTLLMVPEEGLDIAGLVGGLRRGERIVGQGYLNNYRQAKATAMLTGREVIDGGHFLLRKGDHFPTSLAEVTLCTYGNIAQVEEWLAANDTQVQCVVADKGVLQHPRQCDFGSAQRPALGDYPDGVDIMQLLCQHNPQ